MRVAVLLGGDSSEREVSLKSGKCIADALESMGHEVVSIDPRHINRQWQSVLKYQSQNNMPLTYTMPSVTASDLRCACFINF